MDYDRQASSTCGGSACGTRFLAPAVPVMLASIGPRNVELTGELAEGWLPIFLRMDSLPEMQALLATGVPRGPDAMPRPSR